jgi:hypothetical protein
MKGMYPAQNSVDKARQELYTTIAADLRDGKTYMATAVENNVSLATVYSVAKKYGCLRGKKTAAPTTHKPQEKVDGQ